MKTCPKCHLSKELEQFGICRRLPDGRNIYCRQCDNESNRMYREKNKERLNKQRRERYILNKDIEILKGSIYKKNRALKDPSFKLVRALRDRHSKAVKNASKRKSFRTTDLLGCSSEELKIYIESQFTNQMNWENYGNYWSIDHIYPLSKIDWDNPEQIRKYCHFTNLRPLDKIENIKKGNNFQIKVY